MPVSMEPRDGATKSAGSRGISFLVGAAAMLALLVVGNALLSNAPVGAIVAPNETAGSR